MHRQPRDPTLRERIERIRGRAGGKPTAPVRKRRIPRYQREAKRQRMLYWGMGIVGALIVAILVGAVVYERIIVPNQVLATVGNTQIRRNDYWRVKAYDLLQQATGLREAIAFFPPEQQQQYLQQADFLIEEADNTWGSTDTDEETLNKMIDDQIYLQHMGELGLSITDEDVNNFILEEFEPINAPLSTPTPTPTWIPARVEMATQTAVAEQTATAIAEQTAAAALATPVATPQSSSLFGTPIAIGSPPLLGPPSPMSGTPVAIASPPVLGPVGTPIGTPAATPDAATPVAAVPVIEAAAGTPDITAAASPLASPVGTPEPGTPSPTATIVPTPNPEQARATAEAGYERFQEDVFARLHLDRASYVNWIVRPAVAREKVDAALEAQIGQSAEQVHAAHILVETRDLAQQLYEQLTTGGADFAQLAGENSIDEATAGNGGDLGWFALLEEPDVARVAFELQPGQISEPFETKYGWQIVKVFERAPDRPLTEDQISAMRDTQIAQWLEEMKTKTNISSEFGPTPTPFAEAFDPPANAPPPPTPTPIPSPPASPVASPIASPVASPVASPEGDASPVAAP